MKVIIKHNGTILDDYGFDKIDIPEIKQDTVLNQNICNFIINKLRFRASEDYDFEYGIGGSPFDEYYKIKNIKKQDNDTKLIVKVSKIF